MIKEMFFISTLTTALFSGGAVLNAQHSNGNAPYTVRTISAMKKVMMGEDLSAHVFWKNIEREHLFAVAPLGRIEGEVTILDGDLFTSVVDSHGQIIIRQNWDIQSPFTVYCHVPEWTVFDVHLPIHSEKELQHTIEKVAAENGYSQQDAFPFRVVGTFTTIDYHIISKPKTEKEHTHALHDKAKKHFHLENTSGEILGFYSTHHEGVFTHKGQFIHTHYMDTKKENMGHLENLTTTNTIKILLPKI